MRTFSLGGSLQVLAFVTLVYLVRLDYLKLVVEVLRLLDSLGVRGVEILGFWSRVALSLLVVARLAIAIRLVVVGPTLDFNVFLSFNGHFGLGISWALLVGAEDWEGVLVPVGEHALPIGEHYCLTVGIFG